MLRAEDNILQYVTTVIYGLTLSNAESHSSYCQERLPITWHHILFFFCGAAAPTQAMASSFLSFLDHTQRHITVGRTSLDK